MMKMSKQTSRSTTPSVKKKQLDAMALFFLVPLGYLLHRGGAMAFQVPKSTFHHHHGVTVTPRAMVSYTPTKTTTSSVSTTKGTPSSTTTSTTKAKSSSKRVRSQITMTRDESSLSQQQHTIHQGSISSPPPTSSQASAASAQAGAEGLLPVLTASIRELQELRPNDGQRLEKLLQQCLLVHHNSNDNGDNSDKPSTIITDAYELAIAAWSKTIPASGRQKHQQPVPAEKAARKCTKLLQELWMLHRQSSLSSTESIDIPTPTLNMYQDTLATMAAAASTRQYPMSSDNSNSRQGKQNKYSKASSSSSPFNHAQRAERLLEEMIEYAVNDGQSHLMPTTQCANHVLQAWSQAKTRESWPRCRRLLDCMVQPILQHQQAALSPNHNNHNNDHSNSMSVTVMTAMPPPDTTSYNIAMECLVQQKQQQSASASSSLDTVASGGDSSNSSQLKARRDPAVECQRLVRQMVDFTTRYSSSNSNSEGELNVAPNLETYTLLAKSWLRSPQYDAAQRVQDMVQQMEDRLRRGTSALVPDAHLYNTVLTTWSRGKQHQQAADACLGLLDNMEELFHQNKKRRIPNTVSYNIALHTLAKTQKADRKDDVVPTKAMDILNRMNDMVETHGRTDCRPDVITYTSCIDAMAKSGDGEKAEALLKELEDAYEKSGRQASLQPNIRSYTSVVHAIARSRTNPERAERLVQRLEGLYNGAKSGGNQRARSDAIQLDVVCYDALLNAYGWSKDYPRKTQKCFEIFQHMVELYKSGQNREAKPDIITCNAILNSAAYADAANEMERDEIMEIAVRTADFFSSANGEYGRTNHMTFLNLLLAMARHMPRGPVRNELATTTFWQCCRTGNLSVPVVMALHSVLPWEDFSNLLDTALLSGPNERKLRFDLDRLPKEWSREAPRQSERRFSRPSRKSSNFHATKSVSLRTTLKST